MLRAGNVKIGPPRLSLPPAKQTFEIYLDKNKRRQDAACHRMSKITTDPLTARPGKTVQKARVPVSVGTWPSDFSPSQDSAEKVRALYTTRKLLQEAESFSSRVLFQFDVRREEGFSWIQASSAFISQPPPHTAHSLSVPSLPCSQSSLFATNQTRC